jgi:hypothetical protein
MGVLVNYITQKWRAQRDDLVGGWCVTPDADGRTLSEGAPALAQFVSKGIADHIAQLHNAWLDNQEKQ